MVRQTLKKKAKPSFKNFEKKSSWRVRGMKEVKSSWTQESKKSKYEMSSYLKMDESSGRCLSISLERHSP